MPEVTHSPMPSMSEEEGGLNYLVHIKSAAEQSSSKPGRLQVLGDVPRKRQSTPVKSALSSRVNKPGTKTSLSSANGLKIKTELEVHAQDEGSTSRPAKPLQRKTPSCTISNIGISNVSGTSTIRIINLKKEGEGLIKQFVLNPSLHLHSHNIKNLIPSL